MQNPRRRDDRLSMRSPRQCQCPSTMLLVALSLLTLALGLVVVEDEDKLSWLPSASQYSPSTCGESSRCVPLASCKLLYDLMDRSCLAPGKLGGLVCGYRGVELNVCCPQGEYDTARPTTIPFTPSTNPSGFTRRCGQPILGRVQGLGAQPWVARVGFVNTKTDAVTYPCCGSIISPRTILTAGHCALASPTSYKLSRVRVGEYDSRGDPDCTSHYCAYSVQDVGISHVVIHPGFEKETYKHDIALLILKKPLNFSMTAQPICILQNSQVPLVGRRAKLVGWGKTPGQRATPTKQQQLELPIIPIDKCKRLYSDSLPVTDDQLCVGGEPNVDACAGFGGAPLILLDHTTHSQYYQVGMASFGSDKCGTVNVPSVYTNVQRYSEWIKNNMV